MQMHESYNYTAEMKAQLAEVKSSQGIEAFRKLRRKFRRELGIHGREARQCKTGKAVEAAKAVKVTSAGTALKELKAVVNGVAV